MKWKHTWYPLRNPDLPWAQDVEGISTSSLSDNVGSGSIEILEERKGRLQEERSDKKGWNWPFVTTLFPFCLYIHSSRL